MPGKIIRVMAFNGGVGKTTFQSLGDFVNKRFRLNRKEL